MITDESVSREYRCVLSLVDALGFGLKLVCGLDDGPVLGGNWIRVSLQVALPHIESQISFLQ